MDMLPGSTGIQADRRLREQIRRELASNRRAYHALLATLTDADLHRPSANAAWTIKEVLFHMSASLAYVAPEIAAARRGKNLYPMPPWLYDWLNVWLARRSSAKQTRQTLAQRYDAAYDATIRSLDTIQEDEWGKRTKFFAFEASIETLFRRQTEHFLAHATEIRQVIERPKDV